MTERILSNRYVLGEVIGTGGMAVVYRAWDRVQLREVAVKVLRAEYNADDEFVRRFNHEAHAASQMSHPNIVNMYDVGQDGNMRYIVMEYVRGRTLKDVIRQTGRIKPQRAVQMTLRILAAVDHAHKSHIVHRDIKPQNILVDAEGNVKVADFGIARVTNANTQTMGDGDSVLGSVHYFSPEQASGLTADEKSDLYSVGVVLYEMVTGKVPFDADSAISVALKHVQEAPRSARTLVPEVSRGLDEVIMKSLEKEGDKRYQTAADFANDLKRAIRYPRGGFVGELSNTEQQMLKQERRERRRKMFKLVRNYVLVALGVTVIVLGAIFGRDFYNEIFAPIRCPDVVMLNVENAVVELESLGLTYVIEQRHSDVSRGTVLEQSLDPDTPIWPDKRIQLVVSAGKEKLMMPNLRDMTRSDAAKLIEQNDLLFNEGDVTLVISELPPGTIVRQEPEVNEWVNPGDHVKLWISGEATLVPTTLGMKRQEGEAMLMTMGFKVAVIERLSPDNEVGTIIDQSIPAGELALLGTPIQLTISQASTEGYRVQKQVLVAIPQGGATVRCTLEENGEEKVRGTETYSEEGSQTITVDLEALTPGSHMLRVYVNDVLRIEEPILFE